MACGRPVELREDSREEEGGASSAAAAADEFPVGRSAAAQIAACCALSLDSPLENMLRAGGAKAASGEGVRVSSGKNMAFLRKTPSLDGGVKLEVN